MTREFEVFYDMKVPRKVQMQKSAFFVQCIQIKRMLSSAAEDKMIFVVTIVLEVKQDDFDIPMN